MKRSTRWFLVLAAVGVVAWLVFTCTFVVDETEYVVRARFGEVVAVYDGVGDASDSATNDRGLHFKLPWPFETLYRFDRRAQLLDPPAREMLTLDRKNVLIDYYVYWRIAEPAAGVGEGGDERPVLRFLRSVGSQPVAEARLQELVQSALLAEVARLNLSDLLEAVEAQPAAAQAAHDGTGLSPLDQLARRVLADVNRREAVAGHRRDAGATGTGATARDSAESLGIEVVDIRLERFNLPEGNRSAIYQRMRAERQNAAARIRTEGEAQARVIDSEAQRDAAQIRAAAEAEADRIRGEGEAEATRIYAQAHQRDPEFYELVRTLDAYRQILTERTTLVLSTSSPVLRLLTEGLPILNGMASAVAGDGDGEHMPVEPAVARDGEAGERREGVGTGVDGRDQ